MPTLPLDLDGGVDIDGGEIPVASIDDVAAQWAEELEEPENAPIRDVVQVGQTAALLEHQRASRYASAQSDPLRATDEYLDEIGGFERNIFRGTNETNSAYRARVNGRPGIVDPNDIIAAVNAVLAPYTSISCRYAERSDGYFTNRGTSTWSSHVFAQGDGGPNAVPNYPDRAYPSAVPTGLSPLPNRRPPGAMPNGDSYGRWFLLRCPDISAVDEVVTAAFDGAQNVNLVGGFFVGAGTSPTNGAFPFDFSSTADEVYSAVIGVVASIVGGGVRWTLIVDPNLSA